MELIHIMEAQSKCSSLILWNRVYIQALRSDLGILEKKFTESWPRQNSSDHWEKMRFLNKQCYNKWFSIFKN